ncbi:MAG: type I pullulanase [Clostridiales bacterium]|nr:type I pullulanase [Clostridiales bacterium]
MTKKTTAQQPWLKLLIAFITVLLIVAFALPLAACSGNNDGDDGDVEDTSPIPAGQVRITINYFRPAGDYGEWNMWIWPNGGEGKAYQFNKTVKIDGENWRRLTVTLPADLSQDQVFGIIVRKGEWASKDLDMDRFILSNMFENNRVTIYLAQNREDIYFDAKTAFDAATSNTISVASFNNYKTLTIMTGAKITKASHFKVYDDADNMVAELNCATTTTYNNKNKALIKFDKAVELSKVYRIVDDPAAGFNKEVNFVGRNINMSSLYETTAFKNDYLYDGELGVEYTAAASTFRVWTPVASALKLNIYDAGEGGTAKTYDMTKGEKGLWSTKINENLDGKYYTYSATVRGTTKEILDPYARSAGRDGVRGMILNLDATNPEGWNDAEKHNTPTLNSYSEAVIYEAQLRDLTIHESSGVSAKNRGKFLGLTETGTKVKVGNVEKSTALDYLKELGVTTVHFQPLFDFATVKEDFNVATYNKAGESNWGYDPLNYNVPEGSYSSNPADGKVRVNEMKQMIMALHNAGLQVVMDVVYNHVSSAQGSNFEALVPGYYFRTRPDGSFFSASGCGNDTASEREMFRKFMVESVLYWTKEYKIDGFRFDLMGLHDIETMNKIYDELVKVNPDVMVYGEGWNLAGSGLDEEIAAIQTNADKMPNIAFFNDNIRDGLKGGVFDVTEPGFVSGAEGKDAVVYIGAVGSTSALSNELYKSMGKAPFTIAPTQSVNYVSAHDNSALWDKLNASVNKDVDVLKAMNRLAAASVLSGQGPAFFLAGEEMLRSKPVDKSSLVYDEVNKVWKDPTNDSRPEKWMTNSEYFFSDNSYKSPDSVNAIDWTKRVENDDMIEYYKSLIQFKRNMPQFQYTTVEQIKEHIVIIETAETTNDGVAVYGIKHEGTMIVIAINANATSAEIAVPTANFITVVNGAEINGEGLEGKNVTNGKLTVGAYSAAVLWTDDDVNTSNWKYNVTVAKA